MALLCNDISHWLGASLESALVVACRLGNVFSGWAHAYFPSSIHQLPANVVHNLYMMSANGLKKQGTLVITRHGTDLFNALRLQQNGQHFADVFKPLPEPMFSKIFILIRARCIQNLLFAVFTIKTERTDQTLNLIGPSGWWLLQ